MPSEFGALLRRLRQAANLSQEALAEAAGISTSAVGAYERGINSAPHRDTVKMLAEALNLSGSVLDEFKREARRRPRLARCRRPATAFTDRVDVPAWRSKPTWYVVAGNDRTVPVALERMVAQRMHAKTITIQSSHMVIISHATAVTSFISTALKTLAASSETRSPGCRR